MGFLLLNFQGSFATFDISKTLYEETFSDEFKKILYPFEFIGRIVLTVIGWRLCQYSKLKYLYLR